MKLATLAERIGARALTAGRDINVELDGVYAGDRISDLLNAAGESVLLVSNVASSHLARVAELMDIPAICLVAGQQPDPVTLESAKDQGTALLVSPVGLFETCGRIYRALQADHAADP